MTIVKYLLFANQCKHLKQKHYLYHYTCSQALIYIYICHLFKVFNLESCWKYELKISYFYLIVYELLFLFFIFRRGAIRMRIDHPQSLNLTFTRITPRSNLLPHPPRRTTRYPSPSQIAVRMRKFSAKNR